MIRVAAVGDVHFDKNSRGRLSRHWPELEGKAAALLLAGDLTKIGHEDEIKVLCEDLAECPLPVITVLGNHDYHLNREDLVKDYLQQANVKVLDHSGTVINVQGKSIGVFGLKGFGGGFVGASCSDFGEQEIKNFVNTTKSDARSLLHGLQSLNTDYKIALLHYSPTSETLLGEKKEIYPFLGSYLLAEAIDAGGADVCFHGHAHKGIEHGATPGGVPVRNVAQPVIGHAFKIYSLDELSEELKRPSEASK
jgi:Icc-related predicted phosphoesterase